MLFLLIIWEPWCRKKANMPMPSLAAVLNRVRQQNRQKWRPGGFSDMMSFWKNVIGMNIKQNMKLHTGHFCWLWNTFNSQMMPICFAKCSQNTGPAPRPLGMRFHSCKTVRYPSSWSAAMIPCTWRKGCAAWMSRLPAWFPAKCQEPINRIHEFSKRRWR